MSLFFGWTRSWLASSFKKIRGSWSSMIFIWRFCLGFELIGNANNINFDRDDNMFKIGGDSAELQLEFPETKGDYFLPRIYKLEHLDNIHHEKQLFWRADFWRGSHLGFCPPPTRMQSWYSWRSRDPGSPEVTNRLPGYLPGSSGRSSTQNVLETFRRFPGWPRGNVDSWTGGKKNQPTKGLLEFLSSEKISEL